MKIGLLGGTFDPPHLGHLAVAKATLWSGEIDTVYLLPCWKHAFGKEPVDFAHRIFMCQQMVNDEKNIYVSADEGEIRSTYSVDILNFIAKQNPDKTFRLILGTDNYWKMDQWENKSEIYRLAKPLWVERPGTSRIPEMTYPLYNKISSTQVRNLLTEGKSIDELVHPKVIEYIRQEGLYNVRRR